MIRICVITLLFAVASIFLTGCMTMKIPALASDEPASEIVPVKTSNIPIAYSFDKSIINAMNFAHIQLLSLQISPGDAIVKTLSESIVAAYPNATVLSGSVNTNTSKYIIYFSLDSFEPEFTYTRSFLDLSDTIHSNVSIAISVRITNAKNEDIYRGIIYGAASKDEQSDTSRVKEELSQTTDAAIQLLGDDFVQKVLMSSMLEQ